MNEGDLWAIYLGGMTKRANAFVIADIYISISMGTFGHRKYKSRGEDGNK